MNNNDLLEIYKICDHGIPYYAYGGNEAACDMANRLNKIKAIVSQERSSIEPPDDPLQREQMRGEENGA